MPAEASIAQCGESEVRNWPFEASVESDFIPL